MYRAILILVLLVTSCSSAPYYGVDEHGNPNELPKDVIMREVKACNAVGMKASYVMMNNRIVWVECTEQ